MTKNIAVVAVGQTKFGELWEHSLRDIVIDAGNSCFNDANTQMSGFERKIIDNLVVGNMGGGSFVNQGHLGPLVSSALGLGNIPAVRCEGACASSALAFRHALHTMQAGKSHVSMVLGVEKMTDVDPSRALNILMEAGDFESESMAGLTFAGLYALMARKHMHDFGTTREQLAMISVTNHKNGKQNPLAQFRSETTVDTILKSSMIADPLALMDCSPITDGGAAIILMTEDAVKKYAIKNPVWIAASACGTDNIIYHQRKSLTELQATLSAMKQIKEQGISEKDINFLEVHDCFSINELVALEDLGFCKKGQGGKFVENNEIALNGSIPTNTTGGLKSIGHPVGATGARQIVDAAKQLRGDSINQLKTPQNGLCLNIGGIGSTAVIHVLSKNKPDVR
ncbi:MAG: thiolase domain-containing protein [Candidatus Aenigmarchaeota archaeon]|nr:thiolase domain-containing protein [Candidatus Aenigmarchaeota archaeon]